MAAVPAIGLNDGHSIPQLGFGVFQVPPPDTPKAAIQPRSAPATATSIPPRCMATNAESGTRCARQASIGRRSTSRASSTIASTSPTLRGVRSTRRSRRSYFDYVDLFLIHWPLPTLYDGDFVSTWKTLEEFKQDGRARSIGVSNFQVPHLRAPRRRRGRRAGGEPGRAPPVLPEPGKRSTNTASAHGIVTEASGADRARAKCSVTQTLARDRRPHRQIA